MPRHFPLKPGGMVGGRRGHLSLKDGRIVAEWNFVGHPAGRGPPASNLIERARMAWTDEELVARSVGGDVDSFNQLILRWERPIFALAYRVIGREEDARDVCQETFLRAFRALRGFKGQAKFSSWLYRIALNLCRDWIRRERRTPIAQAPEGVDLLDLAAEQEPAESIETLVARREMSRAVAKAMALLPEEQRTAIILKEYHGLTFQEIADLLDCPLSTVKTRLYQGLSVLRRTLRADGQSL
jgi:RNA polymerase sigma-70 factor (ECF subfamily)